jgi:hypothetical protein
MSMSMSISHIPCRAVTRHIAVTNPVELELELEAEDETGRDGAVRAVGAAPLGRD